METHHISIKRTCALPGCNVEFEPNDSKQKYCSPRHKSKAFYDRKKTVVNGVSAQKVESHGMTTGHKQDSDLTIPSGLSPTAIFIIENLKDQRDDWKSEWKEERDARRKLISENEALEKQLRDLKHEHEIQEIRGEKPSGLNGLMGSPAMKELSPHIGPALGEFLMGIAKVGTSKMAGLSTSTPSNEGGNLESIQQWVSKLSESGQQSFMEMMTSVTSMDEQTAMYYISNFINLLQSGTTARQTGSDY